ncbi:uncharacterized protein LOC143738109 [Siphateles boraxobius]|uniref:uncharacterized protein LOC143738109 n=1 Tax=Siphateles boraxobius TaxID=180520 RepID=UPI0040631057
MSPAWMIKSFALMWACLLTLPSGRVALSCCRRDFSNGSTACQLSNAPDPTCDTHWSAEHIMVVDDSGETDLTRVDHADPQTLLLRGRHTNVIFQMDCLKESVMLNCNGEGKLIYSFTLVSERVSSAHQSCVYLIRNTVKQ